MAARRSILTLVAALAAVLSHPAAARAEAAPEYRVKAAFIYNFLQFIEWPGEAGGKAPEPRGPVVVATVGRDPFDGELERAMAGKSVGGRAVLVKHFANAADVERCHVLFVGAGSEDALRKVMANLGPVGLLTVGESDEFLGEGGVIAFFQAQNKLGFQISQEAAARARLQISAKLLRLAKLR